ncbi:unnamed protein product [Brassica oleracea]
MAENLRLYDRDPRIVEIIKKSTYGWLGYDDLQSLFEFSGTFLLSKGPASFEEGLYVYEMDHKTDEIEWDFQNHEASGIAGDVRVLYTSFTKKSNVTPSLERRIYICPGHVLCLVHFRFIEEEQRQEAELEEAGEDLTPPVNLATAAFDVASQTLSNTLEPWMQDILQDSTDNWLDYGDLMTLFAHSGKLPLSKGLAAGLDELDQGIYVFTRQESLHTVDWYGSPTKIPGHVPLSYRTSYAVPNDLSLNATMVRRLYDCDEYARYIVHCRLIGGGQEEEQEQEAELEEAGEDRTPPVNLSTVGDVATAASDVTSQTLPNTLEPWVQDILQDSTDNWLDYGDLMTLFAHSGKLPLSKGLAAGLDELDQGIYVFTRQESLHTVDWYGSPTKIPGHVPLSYRTSYAVPNDLSLNATMVRRLYDCDEYARYIVHCRLIGGGQEEEQEQEAELEEAGEDRTPPVNLSTVGDVATAASDVTSQTLPNTLEPWVQDILQDSTDNWLDYGDLMTLFAHSGKLPLSKGLAAGLDELDQGIYVFTRQESLHTVDWYGSPTKIPGHVPLSYRTSYAVPNDPSLNATMVRRLYDCDEYARFIVHCRLIGGRTRRS